MTDLGDPWPTWDIASPSSLPLICVFVDDYAGFLGGVHSVFTCLMISELLPQRPEFSSSTYMSCLIVFVEYFTDTRTALEEGPPSVSSSLGHQ